MVYSLPCRLMFMLIAWDWNNMYSQVTGPLTAHENDQSWWPNGQRLAGVAEGRWPLSTRLYVYPYTDSWDVFSSSSPLSLRRHLGHQVHSIFWNSLVCPKKSVVTSRTSNILYIISDLAIQLPFSHSTTTRVHTPGASRLMHMERKMKKSFKCIADGKFVLRCSKTAAILTHHVPSAQSPTIVVVCRCNCGGVGIVIIPSHFLDHKLHILSLNDEGQGIVPDNPSYQLIVAMKSVTTLATLISVALAAIPRPRTIFNPPVLDPNSETVWIIGTRRNVTWCVQHYSVGCVMIDGILHSGTRQTHPNLLLVVLLLHLWKVAWFWQAVLEASVCPCYVRTRPHIRAKLLTIEQPLAKGFDPLNGFQEVTVPDVEPGNDYQIVRTWFDEMCCIKESFIPFVSVRWIWKLGSCILYHELVHPNLLSKARVRGLILSDVNSPEFHWEQSGRWRYDCSCEIRASQ